MENDLKAFWDLYDSYMQTKNCHLLKDLSVYLSFFEGSGVDKISRPEKGWNEARAWLVTRNQRFVFPGPLRIIYLFEGDVLTFSSCGSVFVLTRAPFKEIPYGVLHPGNFSIFYEREKIYTNERGLYLPLYKDKDISFFVSVFFMEAKHENLSLLKDKKNFCRK